MIVQVSILRKELQVNGLKYVVTILNSGSIIGSWRVPKVLVDGEEFSDESSILTYVEALKVSLGREGIHVTTHLNGGRRK
ncbi:MAG: hypothetical protein QW705_01775 [Zestosphaera sp.]